MREYVRETYGWDDNEQRRLHEQRFLRSATRIIVVDEKDVGLVATRDEEEGVRLLQLFLLPEAQGKGIGAHVLGRVLEEARRGQRRVALQVLKSNPRARGFYQRYGFAVTGETETHYNMETV